ncbi:MAG: RNB domain-containing ribonuclease [Treponema sp.]|nr:RNB domain-containing ribonuclease [Treponema sp.]
MLEKNAVVIYKNQVAVVCGSENDKYLIKYCSVPATSTGKKAVYSEQKVREKDFVVLAQKSCSSLEKILEYKDENIKNQLLETYELLISDDSTANELISIDDIIDLTFGNDDSDKKWFIYQCVVSSYEFCLDSDSLKNGQLLFKLRNQSEIDELKQKDYEKSHADEIKNAFIQRLKQKKLDLPSDSKFMGEVEAFALCKTEKSKILSEAGFSQNIEKAHKLLIDTGIWNITKNPFPTRFGFSFESAKEGLGAMPEEERFIVPGIAYAIDNEHSTDPDDAVSFDGEYLWVHIADPASSVAPDSSIDIAARNRGTTLYIPEGASRMLCENCLEDYALGLRENSKALSFKIKLDEESQIEDCEVLKTCVNVKCITYAQAQEQKDSAELKPLFEIARKNKERREKNNAVTIQMPEVDIIVDKETKKVSIEPSSRFESNDMIAELMIITGEAAARFAFKNQIPFPYVSQESPVFPKDLPDGWAGEFARVKCMRKRSVGITPAPHAGLGVSFYSQVTSPLRRYSDLIAHQQLRAFIDKRRVMQKDEMLEKVAAGDAASIAAKKVCRLSETHWKLIYLLQNPEKTYEAYCIDIRGTDFQFLIPELDMQTTLKAVNAKLNDKLVLKAANIDIPNQTADFIPV